MLICGFTKQYLKDSLVLISQGFKHNSQVRKLYIKQIFLTIFPVHSVGFLPFHPCTVLLWKSKCLVLVWGAVAAAWYCNPLCSMTGYQHIVIIFADNNPHLCVQTTNKSFEFYSVGSNHLCKCCTHQTTFYSIQVGGWFFSWQNLLPALSLG